MARIDGLDIPFQHYADSNFFEPGPEEVETRDAPPRSRSERLWGHPGLRPLTRLGPAPATAGPASTRAASASPPPRRASSPLIGCVASRRDSVPRRRRPPARMS